MERDFDKFLAKEGNEGKVLMQNMLVFLRKTGIVFFEMVIY
jgi:hypothetical protein